MRGCCGGPPSPPELPAPLFRDTQFPSSIPPAGENWKLQKLAERVKFSDIFATAPFNPATGCPVGFKSINADDVGAECLQLKVGP